MASGGTWERLLHTPMTWIVAAVVLFVIAVALLVAAARASRRAARDQQADAAGPTDRAGPTDPAPRPGPAPAGDPATRRLLGALVADPPGALAGVTALERGEEPGRAAVGLLRSGVPAPAVARLCGVAPDDLGDLVAATLGILPEQARSVVAESAQDVPAAPQPRPRRRTSATPAP